MTLPFYKYQGAGNDFVMIDNRDASFQKNTEIIRQLCDRKFGIGGDGLILLEKSDKYDFSMVYFNADGNESSMCGNGGRCIVRFAEQLGIITKKTCFEATDGLHHALLTPHKVSLQMKDVNKIDIFEHHTFLNTGSPHHVEFLSNIDTINIKEKGSKIRYGAPYFEQGTNVNFVSKVNETTFNIRTYERGVEDETLACGTGATAAAIAAYAIQLTSKNNLIIHTLGGELSVSFKEQNHVFTDIWLTGKAEFVFEGKIILKS